MYFSPSKKEYQQNLRQNLNADHGNTKIMSYQAKPVQPPEGIYSSDNKYSLVDDHDKFRVESKSFKICTQQWVY